MITATFRDGNALICVITSERLIGEYLVQDGAYLVRVEPEGESLLVFHSCPAFRFNAPCGHVNEAIHCYRNWRFWEPDRKVIYRQKHIVLQPHWTQIPVPSNIEELVGVAMGEISRAS